MATKIVYANGDVREYIAKEGITFGKLVITDRTGKKKEICGYDYGRMKNCRVLNK